MYTGLLHLHSALRYIVVILVIFAIIKAFTGWTGNKPFTEGDRKLGLFALISVHVQLIIGLILYFVSPVVQSALNDMGSAMQNPELRFWAVEHIATNIIGIALITVGYSTAKRATSDTVKFKRIAIYYLIGFIIIMTAIPWPFMRVPRPWF
uniref:Cytochrome B n=1 Tax=Roseihalotalea indica TaxID=2867963 RepID=A0AA49JH00_9BACT|nr:cytochrome B [Tunicatimonas sp. TK19036]